VLVMAKDCAWRAGAAPKAIRTIKRLVVFKIVLRVVSLRWIYPSWLGTSG
jgi:hypothetical protein